MTKNSCKLKYLYFKDIIGIINEVNDGITLHIEEDRIWVRAVDTANVMALDLSIPKSIFEYYNLKPQTICLELANIKSFAEMAYGYVSIIQHDESLEFKSGKYGFTTRGVESGIVKKEPNVSEEFFGEMFKACVIIKSSEMRKFLKYVSNSADKVRVFISNDGYTEISNPSENDKFTFTIDNGTATVCNSTYSTSLYSMDYLRDCFNKHVKGECSMYIGDDTPCKIELNLDGEKIGAYILAPRIESS